MLRLRVISILLIGVAALTIASEYIADTSVTAVVNAPLAVVRTPIEGTLSLTKTGLGSYVSRAEPLGEVEDQRADSTRLHDLERTKTGLLAELSKTEEVLASLEKMRAAHALSAQHYQDGRVQQLQAKLAEAQAYVEAANSRLSEGRNSYNRVSGLSERGIQTAANFEHARSTYEVAASDLEVALQRVSFLKVELQAAKEEIYLGDSYNDAPYSLQRAKDLQLKIEEQEIARADLKRRLAEIDPYLDIERVRFSHLWRAGILSPTRGLIFELPAKTGETVRKGQDLIHIVDCDSRIITASVSERLYNRLQVGTPAQFRMLGSHHSYAAVVTRLAGPASPDHYKSLAVTPQIAHLSNFDVVLTSQDLTEEGKQHCNVGQSGKVTFSSDSSGMLAGIGSWLGL